MVYSEYSNILRDDKNAIRTCYFVHWIQSTGQTPITNNWSVGSTVYLSVVIIPTTWGLANQLRNGGDAAAFFTRSLNRLIHIVPINPSESLLDIRLSIGSNGEPKDQGMSIGHSVGPLDPLDT